MTDTTVRGKFLWHTLLTADANAAAEFYGKVIGWKTPPASEDSPETLLLALPSGPLAGVLEFPAATENAVAHWLPYIGTPNIHDTLEQCQALGGAVLKDVTAIPNMGEFAVLADPQGSQFAVYMPSGDADGRQSDAELGEFSWHELATTDLMAAIDFYQRLFDWEQIAAHDMGPMGTYLIFGREGKQLGGMFKAMGADPAAPNWLSYIRVPDAEKSAAKVKAAGGQVTNGPGEVPGGDWITQCLDPQGAAFAVHALGKVAKAMPAEPADTETAAADEDNEEFTATLVMDRSSVVVPGRRKPKQKTKKAAARIPATSAKTGKTATKKASKPAAKRKAATSPAKTKSQKTGPKTAKKASKPVAKAGKKVSKRGSKPAKSTARKLPTRPPARQKKAAKRKK